MAAWLIVGWLIVGWLRVGWLIVGWLADGWRWRRVGWLREVFAEIRSARAALRLSEISASRAVIASFLQTQSEQKLVDVLAFSEDGGMDFWSPCCCLVGVFSTAVLHHCCCEDRHYLRAKREDPEIEKLEMAYFRLGAGGGQRQRDRHLAECLRAELDRRAHLRICSVESTVLAR